MWKKIIDWIKSWFEKQPKPKPDVPPEEKPADEICFSPVVIHTAPAEVKTWPITHTITGCEAGSLFRWTLNKALDWKDVDGVNGCIWLFKKLSDGNWHGGPGDYIRTGQAYKNHGDLKFENGSQVEQPAKGELVGIMLSTICRHSVLRNGKARTQIKQFVWPQ